MAPSGSRQLYNLAAVVRHVRPTNSRRCVHMLTFLSHSRACLLWELQHKSYHSQFVTLVTSDSSRRTFTRLALFHSQVLNERNSQISYQKFLASMHSTFRKIDETESTPWNTCDIPGFKVSMDYSNAMKLLDQPIDLCSAERYY
jgi:hypothetical protein